LQAGGRRFDPVWLHQAGSRYPSQAEELNLSYLKPLVRKLTNSRRRTFHVSERVFSDIVKRRSIRAPVVMNNHERMRLLQARDRRTSQDANPRSCAHVDGADRAIVGPILCKLVFQSMSEHPSWVSHHAECGWALNNESDQVS
jgi:hypothetical protein